MKFLGSLLCSVTLWGFIAIKVAGTTLVDWSWWWLLMPPVPLLGLLVRKFGL